MAEAFVMTRPREQQQAVSTPGKQPLSPQLDTSLITSAARKRKVAPSEPASPVLSPAPAAEEGKRQRTPSIDCKLNECDREGANLALRLQLGSPAAELMHAAATPAAPRPLVGATASPPSNGGAPMDAEPEAAGDAQRRQQQPGAWQHAAVAHHAQQQHKPQHTHQQHPGHHGGAGGRSRGSTPVPEEELIFSPVFHFSREGSVHDLAGAGGADGEAPLSPAPALAPHAARAAGGGAAEAQPRPSGGASDAENASTDHSTGTSACLADADVSDASDEGSASDSEGEARGAARHAAAVPAACQAQAEVEEEEGCEGDYLDFDPLLFIKRLPPLERCVPPRREFLLPKQTRRSKTKTLVLDLDETLVHSTLDGYCRPDFTFPVEVGNMTHMVSVRQRPHLHTFLERVAQLFEVVVFTASQRVYAEQLLNIVDPRRRLVRHRVYRESCVFWEGNYLKDLTVLGRDLAHTIIVDNSPQAFGFQIDNGIPIESWYDDDADTELLKLLPFLERVAHADDVRPHIQKRYRLRRLVESTADPEQYPQDQHEEAAQQAQHAEQQPPDQPAAPPACAP